MNSRGKLKNRKERKRSHQESQNDNSNNNKNSKVKKMAKTIIKDVTRRKRIMATAEDTRDLEENLSLVTVLRTADTVKTIIYVHR